MPVKACVCLLSLAFLALLSACGSIRPELDFPPLSPMPAELRHPCALPLYMRHRAILSMQGRDLSLSGRLAIDRERGMRLLVLHSFEQVLADIIVTSSGNILILRKAGWFREAWIRDFLVRDAAILFAPQLIPECKRMNVTSEKKLSVNQFSSNGNIFVYHANEKMERQLQIEQKGKILWQAESFDFRSDGRLPFQMPYRHRVKGENYSLDLSVLSVEILTNAASFFPCNQRELCPQPN